MVDRLNTQRVKPIRLYRPNASPTERDAIYDAIKELMYYSDNAVSRVQDPHVQLSAGIRKGQDKIDRMEKATLLGKIQSRNTHQRDVRAIVRQLEVNKNHEVDNEGQEDYYPLLILPQDLYADDLNYILGYGKEGFGAVISTRRLPQDEKQRYSMLKTMIAHEMGHVFGIPARGRTNTSNEMGRHCTNQCTMRSGNSIEDLEKIALESQHTRTYCGPCHRDLYNYFRE